MNMKLLVVVTPLYIYQVPSLLECIHVDLLRCQHRAYYHHHVVCHCNHVPFLIHPFIYDFPNKQESHRGLVSWKTRNFLGRITNLTNLNIYEKYKWFNCSLQVINCCRSSVSLVGPVRCSESTFDRYCVCYWKLWDLVGMEEMSWSSKRAMWVMWVTISSPISRCKL